MLWLPLLVAAATADPLAAGDVCYRFCEDSSKPPVSRRDECPERTACRPTLPPGTAAFDTCAAPETCQTAALIHRDANFTFVHVGKTGGSSVRAMLRREGFLGVRTRWHSGGVVYNAPYRAPPGARASWPLRVSPGERYVVVLRNPVERFASAFYDLKTKYRKWRPRLDRGLDWGGFSRDEDAMLRPHATLDAFVAAMPIRVDPCRFAHGRTCCCGCARAPWSTCPVAHVRQNIHHYVRHLANHGDQILAVLTQHTLTEDVRRVFGVDMARHAQVNRNPHAAIAPATVGKLAPLLAADFAAIRLLRRMGHLTDAQFEHLMYLPNVTAARRLVEADAPCERAFEAAGAENGWVTGPAVRAYCEREGLMRSMGRETLARVWAQVDVNRDTRGLQVEAFCQFMRLLASARALPGPDDPARALPEPSAPADFGPQSPLAANDVCYRACRDGSKPPIARRDDCPPGTACRATQPPGLYLDNCLAPDTCQARSDAPRVDVAPVRNASGAPGSGSAVACTSTSDPYLRKFVGLRCCRDRATRRPYTVHVGHASGGFRGLTHAAMYEPARETLRRGFLARADECGYTVATYLGPLKPETLQDGDVVISFGTNGPYWWGFAKVANELRPRPIAFINYETEPGGLPARKVGMLLPRHHRRSLRRGPGGTMTEVWSYAFSHGAKAHRIKIVPPGFLERFPIPATEPGPVRVFKWLGMAGRCMDRLPPDVRRRVSETYGVRTLSDWQRTMAANHTVYLNLHKEHCKGGRPSRDLPAEYFRLSAIVSAGGLVVSEPSHPVDEAALKDIVVFEPSIYDKAGGWSAATTELLADAERLRAWRDRALAAYRSRFDPVALLRRADAWNERARGDL